MFLQLKLRRMAARRGKDVPMILQSEASECGLACLAMIASSHGRRCDLRSLREAFSTSSRGVTLRRLIDIAAQVGLIARPLRVELEYIPQLRVPCLLHWGLLHYVVLVAIKGDTYIVHDPALGRRTVGKNEFSRLFTGIAVEFDSTDAPLPIGSASRLTWRAFFRKARSARAEIGAILTFAILLEFLQILAPFYLQWTVDWVLGPGDASMRDALLLVFLAILLAQAGTSFLRSVALLRIGTRTHLAWLTDLFAHALRLPLSFFERRYLGDIMGRFEGISYIQRSITGGFIEMLLDGIMSLGLLAIMVTFSVRLALVSTAAVGCALLVRLALLERLRESLRAHEALHARQQGYFLETIRSLQSIRLFCAEGLRLAEWANLVTRSQNRHLRAERIQTLFRLSNLLIFGLERLFVIWYATRLVELRSISLGMLFSYVTYRELLAGRVMSLLDKYVEAKTVEIHLDRLSDIALAEPEPEGRGESLGLGGLPRIDFDNVWFRYSDDEPWILKGVSGSVIGHTTTAITGPSGCGKSTLLKIMQGLLKPTKGSVNINGVPAADAMQSYRRIIGSVNQGDELFMGTIAENISFFDAPLDIERVRLAARRACIDANIQAMPMQYNTIITDAGSSLSGGQKQRLFLARALYKEPQVLFLDEATSHLDTATEESILALVRQLPMTRIIVAHRPETVAACDRALCLEEGILDTAPALSMCSHSET
jgi:ATP-binding cassette, subfamily B, bacterial CvaB/MchF/RaxB